MKQKSGLKEMGLLNVEDSASFLNVSVRTFQQEIAKEIKPVDIPTKNNFYSIESLKSWVESRVQRQVQSKTAAMA